MRIDTTPNLNSVLTAGGSATSSQLASVISDETGSGALVLGTSPVFTTNTTSPVLAGGSGTTSSLTLKPTTGAGVAGADVILQAGNNGAVEGLRLRTASTTTNSATGGNTIATSGIYTVHTFTSSGTFTPGNIMTVDYLVIAGGGGGGGGNSATFSGAGGGAGGFLTGSLAVTATPLTVTVGGGGNGGPTSGSGSAGSRGSDSVFSSITATGGGGGGGANANPLTGGSGGGATAAETGAAGTAGQGRNGATATGANAGAGGGGAGSVGFQQPGAGGTNNGGNGGTGISSSINGTPTTYSGGGGGGAYGTATAGTGGAGGGASGGATNGAVGGTGTTNTGGGGGGGNETAAGGPGGSGIVIIRYITSQITPTAIGIETAAPTAVLHLPAGTSSINTSPLKLTSGTNLTTPESGSVEFDGTNFYATTNSLTRNALQLASVTALIAGQTIIVPFATSNVFSLIPNFAATLNATGGTAGCFYSIVVTTSGTTSYTLTFGTAFKTTGTLATGTSSAKVFTINFVYDGTNFNEVSRTTAM